MTSWICMKFLENIFRDTDFENFYLLGSDKVVISWFRTFEILWISPVMPKSNHLWWRHFRSIMTSSEFKLHCDSRFWVEILYFSIRFEFQSSSFSLDFVEGGLLFNFQSQKNQSKIALIHKPKVVFSQTDHAESDEHISFLTWESWKILNFNYVSYHYWDRTWITLDMIHTLNGP